MMLVHKQPNFSLQSTMSLSHRRHPSAPPAVVVAPTRTPGLLTLSKPQRPSLHRQLQPQQRQPKTVPKKLNQVVRAPLLESVEISTKKPAAVQSVTSASPSPLPRGRTEARQAKDKSLNLSVSRSASHTSIRGKHTRQPSPPQTQESSQAEVPTIPTQSNLFDPFLDDSPAIKSSPAPSLTSSPSGKLARRRQHQPASMDALLSSPSPAPSKAIPVPSAPRTFTTMSRSDPVPSHMRPRHKRAPTAEFPICDDMNGEEFLNTPPVTPTRTRISYQYDNGPRTAPLSAASPGAFPFTPSPAARKKVNRHRRTPSEGVFSMSSDEDVSTGPNGEVLNSNVRALFGLSRVPAPLSRSSPSSFSTPIPSAPRAVSQNSDPVSRETQYEREAAEKIAGYFASSVFQNSPSPEELPDPLFV